MTVRAGRDERDRRVSLLHEAQGPEADVQQPGTALLGEGADEQTRRKVRHTAALVRVRAAAGSRGQGASCAVATEWQSAASRTGDVRSGV